MLTRRSFIRGLLGSILAGLFASLWAFFIAPALQLRVKKWRIQSSKWKIDALRIAIVSDLHMGEPYVGLKRLRTLVRRTNALGADIIVILGDLTAGHRFVTKPIEVEWTAKELAALKAPPGEHSGGPRALAEPAPHDSKIALPKPSSAFALGAPYTRCGRSPAVRPASARSTVQRGQQSSRRTVARHSWS